MTNEQFLALCERAGKELSVAQSETLREHGQVEIDGVAMGLFFDQDETPGMIFCYVDLGAVDRQQRADIYENLLTLNLLSGSKTTGVYALDPASGNAMFIVHLYEPEEIDASVLVAALHTYAAQAKVMRAGLLKNLAPPPAPQGQDMAPMVDLA